MTEVVVYADNSLCIDGKFKYPDDKLLKRLHIPIERSVNYKFADHAVRCRRGTVGVVVFSKPEYPGHFAKPGVRWRGRRRAA